VGKFALGNVPVVGQFLAGIISLVDFVMGNITTQQNAARANEAINIETAAYTGVLAGLTSPGVASTPGGGIPGTVNAFGESVNAQGFTVGAYGGLTNAFGQMVSSYSGQVAPFSIEGNRISAGENAGIGGAVGQGQGATAGGVAASDPASGLGENTSGNPGGGASTGPTGSDPGQDVGFTAPDAGPGGAGGPGGASSVICTELHRQGFMDAATWQADERYGRLQSRAVLEGYWRWGRPVARAMATRPWLTRLIWCLGHPWVEEMAFQMGARERGSRLGRLIMALGTPICARLGKGQGHGALDAA